MADSLAHQAATRHRAVDWHPEQVESGPEGPVSGTQAMAAQLARGLGWFSLALGVAQVLAPARVARTVGVPTTSRSVAITRFMGMREIAHGAGILTSGRPTPWMWTRVVGDALDLGLLGGALRTSGSRTARVAGAIAAVGSTTAADVLDSVLLSRSPDDTASSPTMRVKAAVTIGRSPDDLYQYWRDFENLPDVMTHLQSVELLDEGRSKWTTSAPVGTVSWEAEIVEDAPGNVIAWRSLPGSRVETTGEVRFKPAPRDRGTELHVLLHYHAPGGPLGTAIAKVFGEDPVQQVKDDLRRFKQAMETGQVVRSQGAPRGTDAGNQPLQQPARPSGGWNHDQRTQEDYE